MNKLQRSFVRAESAAVNLPSANVQELLIQAFQHHQAGDLGAASAGYQAVLGIDGDQADALHLLGVLALQLGDASSAVKLIERSVSVNPSNSDALSNLGNALLQSGQTEGAERAYRRATNVDSNNAGAQFNLGNVLYQAGRAEEAVGRFNLALAVVPDYVDAHFNRAAALYALDRFQEAADGYELVRGLDPERASLHSNLGSAYAGLKRWEEARVEFETAIAQNPNDALAHANLGNVLGELEERLLSIEHLEKAVEIAPDNIEARFSLARAWMYEKMAQALEIAELTVQRADARARDWYLLGAIQTSARQTEKALLSFEKAKEMDPNSIYESNHLGVAFMNDGHIDQAISFFKEMLAINPENDISWSELGVAYKDLGDVPLALATMRKGLSVKPNSGCHSNLLFTLYYTNDCSAQQILEEAKAWADRYCPEVPAAPLARPTAGRKIKLGFLSADFHAHPAGYLYEALFPQIDRTRFEVHLYLNQDGADQVTWNIVNSADNWRIVKTENDEALAKIVRDDEIDIFVDLLGHTNNHRLPVFGLRPAPVQVGWLGYFGTTGMAQMDYIIADKFTLPENEEKFYTEAPARMPGSMYVFQVPQVDVAPGQPPMIKNGYPTFGCFNNTPKITPEVVALWCRVMRDIPESRMILNRWPYRTEMAREHYRQLFEANGVSGDRIEFRATKGQKAYFEVFNDVDVILDTFPFGGGTTTSGALWMGVPVVTLPSDRLVGHMTETIFHAVGVEDLLVSTPDEFVDLAKSLAGDPDRLSEYRLTLRKQTEQSRLCDLPRFARDLEGLFVSMMDAAVLKAAA